MLLEIFYIYSSIQKSWVALYGRVMDRDGFSFWEIKFSQCSHVIASHAMCFPIGLIDWLVFKFLVLFQLRFVGRTKTTNLLSKDLSRSVLDFDEFIRTKFNYTHQGRVYNFGRDFCGFNKLMCPDKFREGQLFFKLYHNDEIRNDESQAKFTYPVMEVLGQDYYIGQLIEGRRLRFRTCIINQDHSVGSLRAALLFPLFQDYESM